jgi:hypothetical protein
VRKARQEALIGPDPQGLNKNLDKGWVKNNPYHPTSSGHIAFRNGWEKGIAEGRRLADRRWKRMIQTFRRDWKGVVVTCDEAADKLLRLRAARSKREKAGRTP